MAYVSEQLVLQSQVLHLYKRHKTTIGDLVAAFMGWYFDHMDGNHEDFLSVDEIYTDENCAPQFEAQDMRKVYKDYVREFIKLPFEEDVLLLQSMNDNCYYYLIPFSSFMTMVPKGEDIYDSIVIQQNAYWQKLYIPFPHLLDNLHCKHYSRDEFRWNTCTFTNPDFCDFDDHVKLFVPHVNDK